MDYVCVSKQTIGTAIAMCAEDAVILSKHTDKGRSNNGTSSSSFSFVWHEDKLKNKEQREVKTNRV